MRQSKAWLGVLLAVFLPAGAGSAQTTTGTIRGRVLDEQGLSLPGGAGNVEGPSLQGAASFVTSENGDYLVGLLPPGLYTLTFQLNGFERQKRVVVLAPTQTLPLDVVMGLSKVTEEVAVPGNTSGVLTRTPRTLT